MMTILCIVCITSSFSLISTIQFFLSLSQPYYSTRVNAADIDSRVKQLDQTTQQKDETEGQNSKAGFWEEFDVRFDLAPLKFKVVVNLWCKNHRVVLKWGKANLCQASFYSLTKLSVILLHHKTYFLTDVK